MVQKYPKTLWLDIESGMGALRTRTALAYQTKVLSSPLRKYHKVCEREGRKLGSKDPRSRSPCDPSMFSSVNGPSIAEDMHNNGVKWIRGDNKRVQRGGHIGGWNQMRNRMKGLENGEPLIYTFNNSYDSIRTIPVLQHDKNKAEDLDTTQEDHAADEWRYACMSRPRTAPKIEPFNDDTWSAPTAAQIERRLFNGS